MQAFTHNRKLIYCDLISAQQDYRLAFKKFQKNSTTKKFQSTDLQSNFIEMTLWHGLAPVNLLHIFRNLTIFAKMFHHRCLRWL